MKYLIVLLFSQLTFAETSLKSIVDSIEVDCGIQVRAGVDRNRNKILDLDEVITTVLLCDKDKDYDSKNPMKKTIIRTQVK